MAKYSKAIAAAVSALIAFAVAQFGLDMDAGMLEGAILAVLTAAGVYVAPANG